MEKYIKLIKDYSKNEYTKMTRKPDGNLKYPYIVPGSAYTDSLWDWDSWLTDIAVRQIMLDNHSQDEEYLECEKGCILNFFEHIDADGRIPISIMPDSTLPDFDKTTQTNIHKPCLAQHAAFIIKESGDSTWLAPYFDKLERFIDAYRKFFFHKETGLFFWIDDMAIGVDNDPCTFYRPHNSSASIFLNCLMYKEFAAMEYICDSLGKDSGSCKEDRIALGNAIRKHLWDERNGFYYNTDINLLPIDPNEWLHSGMPRHWDALIQKIDVWSGIMALWAGIATKEQAERIVRENLLNENTLCAKYGIRSLSKLEQMYLIVKSGNPSCWLGPVWGIVNYIAFQSLVKYGYEKEARELAEKLITLFGKDIEQCGEMHEYYHPDTGEGVNNQGFQSWNMLINNIIAWYESRPRVEEF